MLYKWLITILCVVAGLMVGIISYLMEHITIIRAVRVYK